MNDPQRPYFQCHLCGHMTEDRQDFDEHVC